MYYTSCWRRRPSQHGRGVVAVAVALGQWQVLSVGDPYVGVMTVLPLFGTLLGRYFRVEQEPELVPQALAQMEWGMWHDRSSGVG